MVARDQILSKADSSAGGVRVGAFDEMLVPAGAEIASNAMVAAMRPRGDGVM